MGSSARTRAEREKAEYEAHMEAQKVRERAQANIREQGIPVERGAASMNAVDSETGRVERESSDTSRKAAFSIDARNQRGIILEALRVSGVSGMTSIEAAAIMPPTRQGGPQVSNRAASRLGELWEAGHAFVVRERGRCKLGVCHEHEKPRAIHKPVAPCATHGKPLTRDKAAIWRAEREQ